VVIEDAASGQSLVQSLKAETRLPILPVKALGDKQSRAHAVSPLVESGKVSLPESASWLTDFLDEATAFPASAHDDMVDALTQALNYLHGVGRGWQPSDGGYQSVVRSVWAPAIRGGSQREIDAREDAANDQARRMRLSGCQFIFRQRGTCW
jgi:hypothetical protein